MNGIKVLDRPASQNFYAVAGRLLFVQNSDPQLAARIEQLFSGWQLAPVFSPECRVDININFFSGSDLPDIPSPPGLTRFEIADSGRCFSTGDEFYLVFENSLVHLRSTNPVVDVAVSIRKFPSPSDAELAHVTSFAVCAALRRFGLFELHSAGVIIPDTANSVLLIGPSGSGKSTLTSQLAAAGWSYLSDDELLLSLKNNEVEARGFRSFFALSQPASVKKKCFEPESVFTARRVDRATPRFVFFTALNGTNETHWRELTQAETMSRLIRACPWASYDTHVAGPYLDLLSRLARQTKGFNLMAGTDLLDATNASRIINEICRE